MTAQDVVLIISAIGAVAVLLIKEWRTGSKLAVVETNTNSKLTELTQQVRTLQGRLDQQAAVMLADSQAREAGPQYPASVPIVAQTTEETPVVTAPVVVVESQEASQ